MSVCAFLYTEKNSVPAGPSFMKFGIGQIYKCLLTCPIFVKNGQKNSHFPLYVTFSLGHVSS